MSSEGRPRHPYPRVGLVGMLLGAVLLGPPALPVSAQGDSSDSRAEELVDSREVVLESATVVRQDDEPAIDTTSRPDEEVVSLRTDVLFDFGSSELNPQADRVIDEAVRRIKDLDPNELEIVGHTDHVGSDSSNQKLSEDRAQAVADALRGELGSGAPPMDVSGRGEADPVAPNENPDGSDNPEGRALNRRVEVKVIS